MRRPYDDGRLSGQIGRGLAQRGTEVRAGRVRKLHALHDRRQALSMRTVVARLVEIRVAHVEETAERRAHVRPSAPEAVVPLLRPQVPTCHEVGHQFRIPHPRAAQPRGELHDVGPLVSHDRRYRPGIVERHRVRFVQLLGQQPHAEQNRAERARAADDVHVQGNRVGGVGVVQKGERRRMPHRGRQRLIFRAEALVEERIAGRGQRTNPGAEALRRIASEGATGQGGRESRRRGRGSIGRGARDQQGRPAYERRRNSWRS